MAWSIGFGPASGSAPVGEFVRAQSRRYVRRLNEPDQLQLSVNGRDDLAAACAELETDVWLRRDSVLMQRLRLGVPRHSLDGTQHRMALDAFDYTWILEFRLLAAGDTVLTQTAQDQADIAWRLVNATQGRTGGGLGIVQGTNGFTAGAGNTGVDRDRTYAAGDVIGKRLAELAAVDDGFDFAIDGTKALQIYYPQKGSSQGAVLDYGGIVAELEITGQPAGFSNVVYVQGSQTTSPIYQATAGVGTDPRGRWEGSFSYSTVELQTTLAEKADGLIVERARVPRSYKAKLRRGAWTGLGFLDVGDTVRVVAKSGAALQVNATARVMELAFAIDDEDGEEVTVTMEQTT